ncbi:MAG TPA: (2Fe-2S)-binding protein [Thermoanaerobaculia bacterium]|nr:(2Fe-2S)-binding protein [Thermoanaerobaculia bacterium]
MNVRFVVNGEEREAEGAPLERLLDVLREQLALTGTKEGCGEGECGACTVLLDGEPALSCLVPLAQCAGRDVRTVEGVAALPAGRRIVERLVAAGGVQCGACTPGIVVTAFALFERDPAPTRQALADALAGNLCRCTGYEGIFRALTDDAEQPTVSPARPGAPAVGEAE